MGRTRPALAPTPRPGWAGQPHTLSGSSSASQHPPCRPTALPARWQQAQTFPGGYRAFQTCLCHTAPRAACAGGEDGDAGDTRGRRGWLCVLFPAVDHISLSGTHREALTPLLKPPQSSSGAARPSEECPEPRGRFRAESSTAQLPASPPRCPALRGSPFPAPAACQQSAGREERGKRSPAGTWPASQTHLQADRSAQLNLSCPM